MRPLDKGSTPLADDGSPKQVSGYREWRKDLKNRTGYYCAYCNIPLSHALQVEHVCPKNPLPGDLQGSELDWENMLLACGPCNNAKDNNPIAEVYMPEEQNSLLPFVSEQVQNSPRHRIIQVKDTLSEPQEQKAEKTIRLFKWQEVDERDAIVDLRAEKRQTAHKAVQSTFEIYLMLKSIDIQKATGHLGDVVKQTGFFLLWFEAFEGEPEALKAIIDAVPGTAQDCFDPVTYQPIPRNPSNTTDPI